MIEAYLETVRRGLKGLPAREADDIVAELRTHLIDTGAADPAATLGEPRALAAAFLAERTAARAETDRSPWRLLSASWRLAGLSLDGFVSLIVAGLGYAAGLGLAAMALLKPFTPQRIGLWVSGPADDPTYSIGRALSPVGQEVLGWWIIPLGLLLGGAMLFLTWRFSLAAVRRLGRRARLTTTRS